MADILLSVGLQTGKLDTSSLEREISSAVAGINSSKKYKVEIGVEVTQNSISVFKQQLTQMVRSISLDKGSPIKIDIADIGTITSMVGKLDDVAKAASAAGKSMGELKKQAASVKLDHDLAKLQTDIRNKITSLTKYTTSDYAAFDADSLTAVQQSIASLKQLDEALANGAGGKSVAELREELTKIVAVCDPAAAKLRMMFEESRRGASSGSMGMDQYNQSLAQSNNLLTQVLTHLRQWTAAKHGVSAEDYKSLQAYAEQLRSLIRDLPNLSPEKFAARFQEISRGVRQAESSIKVLGENTQSVLGKMMGMPGKILQAFGISRVLMTAIRAIREMINSAIDLDSAMTQLQIVTGATDDEMTQFLTKATSLAKELGVSISDVAKSIEVFSRLGYNLPDASVLAEYATVLSNVAKVSTEEATTGMTSIIKGFSMPVENAEHVADVLVEVGQKYAVSASEIMEAFEKSGAALNATNTSFEKSAGLIAAANAAVQNASTVGRVLPIRTVMCA